MNPVARLAALLLVCAPALGYAHKSSDSFLHLSVDAATLSGRWDIALRDLDYAIGLDADGNGDITWGEVRTQQRAIEAYALTRLHAEADGDGCALNAGAVQIVSHSDGHYAVLPLRAQCLRPVTVLRLRYHLLFDVDAQHRGLLQLDWHGARGGVFAPERQTLRFEADDLDRGSVFGQYLNEGVFHVWSGLDHLLFLAALLLPAVLRRTSGGWIAEPRLPPVLWETARIVTAFTVAHALSLSLAATGVLNLPSHLVESLVAATVVFAGVNNLLPLARRGLFWLAWGFGLVHGAAIASVLMDLGLPARGRVAALLAFNIGVEFAQLSVIAAVIPLTFVLRHSLRYRRWVLIPGSVVVTAVGVLWLVERTLDREFLPF